MNRISVTWGVLVVLGLVSCGDRVRVTSDDRAEAVEMLAKQASGVAPRGYQALPEAAGMGKAGVCAELLRMGVPVDSRGAAGETALMRAAGGGSAG